MTRKEIVIRPIEGNSVRVNAKVIEEYLIPLHDNEARRVLVKLALDAKRMMRADDVGWADAKPYKCEEVIEELFKRYRLYNGIKWDVQKIEQAPKRENIMEQKLLPDERFGA